MSTKIKLTAPSFGDVIDLGGKVPQFKAFAFYVYKELVANNLDWIRVADPAALKIDDIQFATINEINAYQVKWSNKENPTPFSFNDFINLYPQLCEGYKALKKEHKHSSKRLKVHLLTNRPLSIRDHIKNTTGKKIGSFSDFYSNAWYYLKTGNSKSIDKKWNIIIKKLERISGLNKPEYKAFLTSCEIVVDDLKSLELRRSYEDHQLMRDVNHLFQYLLEKVIALNRQIEIKNKEILADIGWQNRNSTIFNHDFIVDSTTYQPIKSTITELNNKLQNINSGYLYLAGSPGSGKSSLLTTWIKERPERIVRYYAYTNLKANDNLGLRGETNNLFFDLVQQLREKGIWNRKVMPYKEDAEAIQQGFYEQIELLGNEYKKTKLKTLILIDGLDHVPREYKPKRSFLADLPAPESLPEGVIFILGSQTYELDDLNPRVKNNLLDQDRLIKIQPLNRAAISKLIDHYNLPAEPNQTERREIVTISQGHPLYLTYILKFLKEKIKNLPIAELLKSLPPFQGDIEKYYNSFWLDLKGDVNLAHILGLLARIKGSVLPDFISEWNVSSHILQSLKSKAIHFFETSSEGWSLFHNSFRQFLIQKSSINILTDTIDKTIHKKLHKKLASYYQKSTIEPGWKSLYHYYEAEEYEEFIKIATPEYFNQQLLDFRPFDQIEEEIIYAIKIAEIKNDTQILIRYLLSLLEFQTRDTYIRAASFCSQFIRMGQLNLALQNLIDNGHLLVNEKFALDTVMILYNAGDIREANKLFSLLNLEEIHEKGIKLKNSDSDRQRDEILRNWVTNAVLFEPLASLFAKFDNISELKADKRNGIGESRPKDRMKRLFYMDAAISLINHNRNDDFRIALSRLNPRTKVNVRYWIEAMHYAVDHSFFSNQKSIALTYLAELLSVSKTSNLSIDQRLRLANTIFRVSGDKKAVVNLLREIEEPEPIKPDDIRFDGDLNIFYPLFWYHKLRWLIGKGKPADKAIPDSDHSNEKSLVEFKRMICRIARINAESYNTPLKPISLLEKEVLPLIRFFYKPNTHPTYKDLYWYRISQIIPQYLALITDSVSRYGKSYLEMLKNMIESEIVNHSQFWSADAKRSVLLALYNNGIEKDFVLPRINIVESSMLNNGDLTQRVEQCTKQANALLELGEAKASLGLLKKALKQSFGVGYSKDFQLEVWIDWLEKINLKEGSKAGPRIGWLASRLYLVKQTSERSTAFDAGIELLRSTLDWNIAAGTKLFIWLLEKELIPFERGLKWVITAFVKKADKSHLQYIVNFSIDVLFMFLERYSHAFFQTMLVQIKVLLNQTELTTLINGLVQAIRLHALEENRTEFFMDILEIVEEIGLDISQVQGFPPPESMKRKDSIHHSPLIIRKGEQTVSLSGEEVRKQVKSYSDFLALINQEDGWNSYFNWTEVVENIPDLTPSNLNDFYTSNSDSKRSSALNTTFSLISLRLGGKGLAQAFAKRALDQSSEYGWSKGYDGGTRLNAFKALINSDVDNARKLAFQALTDDAITYSDLRSLLPHLDEILPVISENYSIEKTWEEIEMYLTRLMENADPQTDLPRLEDENQSNVQSFDNLLVYLLNSPAHLIAAGVRTFLTKNYAQI